MRFLLFSLLFWFFACEKKATGKKRQGFAVFFLFFLLFSDCSFLFGVVPPCYSWIWIKSNIFYPYHHFLLLFEPPLFKIVGKQQKKQEFCANFAFFLAFLAFRLREKAAGERMLPGRKRSRREKASFCSFFS